MISAKDLIVNGQEMPDLKQYDPPHARVINYSTTARKVGLGMEEFIVEHDYVQQKHRYFMYKGKFYSLTTKYILIPKHTRLLALPMSINVTERITRMIHTLNQNKGIRDLSFKDDPEYSVTEYTSLEEMQTGRRAREFP